MATVTAKVSVIICAHNPRPDYFARVLDALRIQSLPKEGWELLLVDNASSTPLAPTWDISWHPNYRHVHESRLGVATARRRGLQEASSDLIVFVDDDNVLVPNYLADAITIKNEWPALGVWGAAGIIAEFENPPGEHLRPLLPYLALRDSTVPQWSNVFPFDSTPWGAGMCLRSDVAKSYQKYCENSKIEIGSRIGKGLGMMSGEDIEMCYVAHKMGYGIGIFPQLRLTHLIPESRSTEENLLKTYEGTITSNLLLNYKRTGEPPRTMRPREFASGVLRVLSERRSVSLRMFLARVRAAKHANRIVAETISQPLSN